MKIIFQLNTDEFRSIFLRSAESIHVALREAILLALPGEYLHYAEFITKLEMQSVREKLVEFASSTGQVEYSDEMAKQYLADPESVDLEPQEWANLVVESGHELFLLFDEGLTAEELVHTTHEETDTLRKAYAAIDRDKLSKAYKLIVSKEFVVIAREIYTTVRHQCGILAIRFAKK